jgi:hypothetical protein
LLSNEFEQYFLGHHLDTENKQQNWYVCPIPKSQITSLLRGKRPLVDYLKNGFGSAYKCVAKYNDDQFFTENLEQINQYQDIEKFLPNENMVFEIDEFNYYLEDFTTDIQTVSNLNGTNILDMKLEGKRVNPRRR